jgi:hypothetical protein
VEKPMKTGKFPFRPRKLNQRAQVIKNVLISLMMRWAGYVTLMREKRNAYRILVGKPEGKRPLGRP